MMTVILVESHTAKSVKVSSIACFFFDDEHSPEYPKIFYTIVKANSHIVKSLNLFCCLSDFYIDLFLQLFRYAIALMMLLHY